MRLTTQEVGHIVDLPMNDDPAAVLTVVLSNCCAWKVVRHDVRRVEREALSYCE